MMRRAMELFTRLRQHPLLVPLIWGVVLLACVPLMQRVPNGADHYFMIDVGETQIVLNNWGTLHMTGYPHYTMLGNLMTDAMTALGVRPLLAAAWVSFAWGLVALALIYWLMVHITQRPLLSAAVTVAYALTRTVWIHLVIAEIYTFGLAILVGLLLLALWRGQVPGWGGSPYARIYWLALLGGLGVAHHRAIAMVAPALLFAVWGELTADRRKLPAVVMRSLGLGLLGFVPYLYLMVRARQGADWVYGEPGTLSGLWWQFTGQEVAYFIGPPETLADFISNLQIVNTVLLTDLTLPGVVLGLVGLAWGARHAIHRTPARTLLISAGVAYAFHATFYTDILSALILPITLSLVFGWLFVWVALLENARNRAQSTAARAAVALMFVGFVYALVSRNAPFIQELVTDTRGLETIAMARDVPEGATLMMPWGPLYFAVGYAQDIDGELEHFALVDHTADYAPAFADGTLMVPEYIRHDSVYNLDWWRAQLGADIVPHTAAPQFVGFAPGMERSPEAPTDVTTTARLTCTADTITLHTTWTAPQTPLRDLTVFAHLLDADGALLAQDDHAPAYGWHPTSAWHPGEIVQEQHFLPRPDAAHTVRYGLYYQADDASFVNEYEEEVAVQCDEN